nr:beta galactosidase jelly roll domain-containing protein [Cytophagales bacterium]
MRFLTPFLFLFTTCIHAQTLVKGGLQGDKTLILTPKGISSANPVTSKQLGFHEPGEDGKVFELAPDLPGDWTWIAATNVPLQSGKRTNVFFYNSWVGTSEKINTTGRRRDFGNEITAQVASNVYHIALHRESMVENEAFIFLVSPKKQRVIVELPASVFKTQRRLEYDMEAWEAKFVHVVVPPAEHTQVVWKPEPPTRTRWLLRDGWQFAFTKGDSIGPKTRWETVRVPHVFGYWQHFDARPYKDSLDITEMYPRGLGWYRRTFTVPGRFRNQYVKINFLAANQRADVWLNGKYLGKHLGGYTDFHFSLDGVLKFDQPNELLVKVDNRYHFDIAPHTADYNAQGGIYREVELMVWPRLLIRDIRITTPNVTPTVADAQVRVQFNNKSASQAVRVAVNLVNPYGEI